MQRYRVVLISANGDLKQGDMMRSESMVQFTEGDGWFVDEGLLQFIDENSETVSAFSISNVLSFARASASEVR